MDYTITKVNRFESRIALFCQIRSFGHFWDPKTRRASSPAKNGDSISTQWASISSGIIWEVSGHRGNLFWEGTFAKKSVYAPECKFHVKGILCRRASFCGKYLQSSCKIDEPILQIASAGDRNHWENNGGGTQLYKQTISRLMVSPCQIDWVGFKWLFGFIRAGSFAFQLKVISREVWNCHNGIWEPFAS